MRFIKFKLPLWVAGGLVALTVTTAEAQVPVVPNVPQEDAYQLRALPPQEAAQEAAAAEEEGPTRYLETELLQSRGINTYGWVAAGIGGNNWGAPWNGPITFNDRNWMGQMNQLYLVNEKTLDTGDGGWDWGGRVDLLYGTDYIYTTARGRSGSVLRGGAPIGTTAWQCRSSTVSWATTTWP
jgi:hypothetical protein